MDLSLQEHLDLLGIKPDLLAFCAGVPKEVVKRALAGQEIARPHADAIAYQLSEHHGLKGQVGFKPEDIKGLKIYQPPEKATAEKPNIHRMRIFGK